MDVTRRNLAVVGAVAIGTASLLRDLEVRAAASDEAAIARTWRGCERRYCRQTRFSWKS